MIVHKVAILIGYAIFGQKANQIWSAKIEIRLNTKQKENVILFSRFILFIKKSNNNQSQLFYLIKKTNNNKLFKIR